MSIHCVGGERVHELAIAESIVAAVCAAAAGRRVHCVTVRVGALTAVVPDAMRFCFELAVEGTAADGARLEIVPLPGSASCRDCGATVTLESPILLCPCGSADLAVTAGRELQIVSMEVG
jgi:hydrogenase nickel incorporation protein HypA/HybF